MSSILATRLQRAALRRMRTAILTMVIAVLWTWMATAQEIPGADRDDFVTASLLIADPTEEVYSVFGHASLHMECPSAQLDYVFSFDINGYEESLPTLFTGRAHAGFIAHKTSDFLSEKQAEGRGIREYKLNLTPKEKQELWRALDEDVARGFERTFTLTNNCTSMTLQKIYECLQGERLVFAPWQGDMTLDNGSYVSRILDGSPWLQFTAVSLLGTYHKGIYDQESRLTPQALADNLRRASFVSDSTGMRRQAISEEGHWLVKPSSASQSALASESATSHSWFTPTVCGWLLLILTVLVTVGEWKYDLRPLAYGFDIILAVLQALAFAIILYVCLSTEALGIYWNWLLLPTLPLPLLRLIAAACSRGHSRKQAAQQRSGNSKQPSSRQEKAEQDKEQPSSRLTPSHLIGNAYSIMLLVMVAIMIASPRFLPAATLFVVALWIRDCSWVAKRRW